MILVVLYIFLTFPRYHSSIQNMLPLPQQLHFRPDHAIHLTGTLAVVAHFKLADCSIGGLLHSGYSSPALAYRAYLSITTVFHTPNISLYTIHVNIVFCRNADPFTTSLHHLQMSRSFTSFNRYLLIGISFPLSINAVRCLIRMTWLLLTR